MEHTCVKISTLSPKCCGEILYYRRINELYCMISSTFHVKAIIENGRIYGNGIAEFIDNPDEIVMIVKQKISV
jgi:hypothetical protein